MIKILRWAEVLKSFDVNIDMGYRLNIVLNYINCH